MPSSALKKSPGAAFDRRVILVITARYHHWLNHSADHFFFFLMIGRPQRSTLFPYTPLFQSKQAIKRALINSVQPIHIPAYMVEMMTKLKVALRETEDELGRPATTAELAAHMKLSPKKLNIIKKAVK